MKKFCILMILALSLLLAGCGKVGEAEAAIGAIGTVNHDSEPAIAAAEALVEELSPRQQEKVENIQLLRTARETYTALMDTEAAINAIGKVSPNALALIEAAENAYEALPDAQKEMVKNKKLLSDARESYDEMAKILDEAENAVAAIGEVTLHSEAAIETAVKAVKAAEDAGLTGYFEPAKKTLQDAQDRLMQLQAEELMGQIRQYMDEENYEAALNAIVRCENDYPRYADTGTLLQYMQDIGDALEKTRPRNGKFFNKRINGGENKIVIHAGQTDVLVKIENVDNPKQFVLYYVRAGETFFFNIACGVYDFRYATGPYWFGEEAMFGSELGVYTASAEPIDLELKEEDGVYYFTILDIYLNDELPEEGENMDSVEIGQEDF